ncbi:MAG: hypothetical protein WC205_04715 [Opitutaceae bacterium]|jgi:hypothetical protein
MASNKKIERAKNGPGLFEITFGVLLSIILGVLLAAVHLALKPVTKVTKQSDATDTGVVYFVEGASSSSKSSQWKRKRQMLTDGGSVDVSFTEEELNAWMANVAPKPKQGAAAASTAVLTPEHINFRIQSGVMQVGVLGKLSAFGFDMDMVVQARGKFVPGPDGFDFEADEFYIGSLPVHAVPRLTPLVIKKVLAAQEFPEDLKTTWKQLKLVAVEDNSLHLTLP